MLRRLAALLLAFALLCPGARADEKEAFVKEHLDGLSGAKALEAVKLLAGDKMKGRKTAAEGGGLVENWMLEKMSEFGLHPADAGGTYLEPFRCGAAKGHNALGAIKGRDPDLVHEIILVSAPMDGPGMGPDGKVLAGADAGASGTAVMIHLADTLTANRLRPKRTIIFCGFGAAEQGLLGSRALAERYPFQGNIVAVLNVDRVGQGEPVVHVDGGASFPKVQELFRGAIPEAQAKHVAFGPYVRSSGDHTSFLQRGVPAFSISTRATPASHDTPRVAAAAIKPACLETTAHVVGRLLLALAMHEKPLHDEMAVAEYLVREGPRYAMGMMQGAEGSPRKPLIVDPTTGVGVELTDKLATDMPDSLAVHGSVWSLVPTERGRQEWKALAKRAEGEGARLAVVRSSAEMLAAWRQRRFGLLPYGNCLGTTAERVALLERYARDGVALVAPWSGLTEAQHTPALIKELAGACKRLKLLPDLGVLSPEHRKLARAALGDAPAIAMLAPQHLARGDGSLSALGAETLILAWGSPGETLEPALAAGAHPRVLLDAIGTRGTAVLDGWGRKQPEGWSIPGTPQRAAVRAILGGHLLTWLAKVGR